MRFQRRETTRPAGTPVCLFVSVPVTDPRPSLHQHTVALCVCVCTRGSVWEPHGDWVIWYASKRICFTCSSEPSRKSPAFSFSATKFSSTNHKLISISFILGHFDVSTYAEVWLNFKLWWSPNTDFAFQNKQNLSQVFWKTFECNNLIRKSPRIFKLMAQLYLLEGWVVATACIFSSVQAIDMFSILWIKYGFMRLVNHFILFLFTQHPNVLCKCARTNLQSSFFFLFTLSVSFLLTFSLC